MMKGVGERLIPLACPHRVHENGVKKSDSMIVL